MENTGVFYILVIGAIKRAGDFGVDIKHDVGKEKILGQARKHTVLKS